MPQILLVLLMLCFHFMNFQLKMVTPCGATYSFQAHFAIHDDDDDDGRSQQ
jgi:hypothetical protein